MLSNSRKPAEDIQNLTPKMKYLTLLFGLLLVSCSGNVKTTAPENIGAAADNITESITVEKSDTLPPFEVAKRKAGGFDAWTITENKNKIADIPCVLESCPAGIFDTPASKKIQGEPVSARDATWSAALRALKNLVPNPDAKIIFDYSKLNRQINNGKQCLFAGPIQIKNENGKYVEAEINLTVTHFWDDYRQPSSWYVTGNIVF